MILITKIEAREVQGDVAFIKSAEPTPLYAREDWPAPMTGMYVEKVKGSSVVINGKRIVIGFTEEAKNVLDLHRVLDELSQTRGMLEMETMKYDEICNKYVHAKSHIREFEDASFFKRLVYLFTRSLPE